MQVLLFHELSDDELISVNSVNEQSDCVVNKEKSDQDPTGRSLNFILNIRKVKSNIDPNNNYFSSANMSCLYYTNDTFNDMADKFKGISVIHFNARSLNKNISNIKDLLPELHL